MWILLNFKSNSGLKITWNVHRLRCTIHSNDQLSSLVYDAQNMSNHEKAPLHTRLTSAQAAWVTQSQFSFARCLSLLGRQWHYEMISLPDLSTHDQQLGLNPRCFNHQSNAFSTKLHSPTSNWIINKCSWSYSGSSLHHVFSYTTLCSHSHGCQSITVDGTWPSKNSSSFIRTSFMEVSYATVCCHSITIWFYSLDTFDECAMYYLHRYIQNKQTNEPSIFSY